MPRRPSERVRRLRIVIRYFMDHGLMREGTQAFLARRFDLTRQRVNQIVAEERARRDQFPVSDRHDAARGSAA